MKIFETFKKSTTACKTINNYSPSNFSFNGAFYIVVEMTISISVCKPDSSTFTNYKFSLLLINYFSIPLYLIFTIRKEPAINSIQKVINNLFLKKIIETFMLIIVDTEICNWPSSFIGSC